MPDGSRSQVAVGSKVLITIGKTVLDGTVTNISPQSQQNLVDFNVALVDSRNEHLSAGLNIEMQVIYGYKDNVVLVPNGPYFNGPGKYAMFVVDGDGNLQRREVQLGDSNREQVEVISGLKPGERVVVSDMSNYKSARGLKVKSKK
jgi:HlyD family secretion protein